MARVWIDTVTGTWGVCDGSLVIVEVTEGQIEALGEMSDSDIADVGLKEGRPV
jgi:hypothetical protein